MRGVLTWLFCGGLAVLAASGCGADDSDVSSDGGASTDGGTGGGATPPGSGGSGGATTSGGAAGAAHAAGSSGASVGGTSGSGPTGGVGGTSVPVQGEPCGEGWGTDPIPGSVDLGLASNPETLGINGGSPDERAIFDQINAERTNVGLEPLEWSDQVANVARSHAADMNQLDYFDHGSSTRPYRVDGVTNRDNWLPFPRLDFVYPGDFRRAGENIASTGDPVARVVGMWMDSDGHRAAILDEYGWTATHGAIGIDGRMVVFNPAQCAQ